jgi:hypothetical protein
VANFFFVAALVDVVLTMLPHMHFINTGISLVFGTGMVTDLTVNHLSVCMQHTSMAVL